MVTATTSEIKSTDRHPERYKECWCLFIDIIGTKNIINNADENQLDFFEEVLDIFSDNNHSFDIQHHNSVTKFNFDIKNSSDHMIISFPVDCWEKENEINREYLLISSLLNKVAIFYGMALERGILLRGALTRGEFNYKKSFGPALIEAVELEGSATYPRIIVSENAVEFLDKIQCSTRMNRDFDNKPYIDCLKSTMLHPSRRINAMDLFKSFKNIILKNLSLETLEDKHLEKWRWLASEFDDALNYQECISPSSVKNSFHEIDSFNIKKETLKPQK